MCFKDKYGICLYAKDLSTSSKILITMSQTDLVLNADELGNNAYGYLCQMTDGSIAFNTIDRDLDDVLLPFMLNTTSCKTDAERVKAEREYYG